VRSLVDILNIFTTPLMIVSAIHSVQDVLLDFQDESLALQLTGCHDGNLMDSCFRGRGRVDMEGILDLAEHPERV
jgi:hypothetical protein